MTIIKLPPDFIGHEDKERLEHFAGHLIAHGKATRWHWDHNRQGSDILEIYRGGQDERLLALVGRHNRRDQFFAEDGAGNELASGRLDHVMAMLEQIAENA